MASYALVPSSSSAAPSQSLTSTNPAASTSAQQSGLPSVSIASTSSGLGLHDAVRYGPRSLSAEVAPKHPLEARLANWDATQSSAKLTLQRGIYGLGMPLRQLMERDIVRQGTMPSLPGQTRASNLHMDILLGRDETLDVSDAFLPDRDVAIGTNEGDFHTAMEKRLNI